MSIKLEEISEEALRLAAKDDYLIPRHEVMEFLRKLLRYLEQEEMIRIKLYAERPLRIEGHSWGSMPREEFEKLLQGNFRRWER